jgi:hypothetical protein
VAENPLYMMPQRGFFYSGRNRNGIIADKKFRPGISWAEIK